MEQIIYLVFVGLGIVVVLIGLFRKSREHELIEWNGQVAGGHDSDDIFAMHNGENHVGNEVTLSKLEEHWAEIDKALEEFHSTANTAIMELDDKYQEMLFLYSLIDDKKKEVLSICNTEPLPAPAAVNPKPPANSKTQPTAAKPRPAAEKTRSSHPRRKDILNLSKQGLSVSEIAQELNVGQDMVSLILEMGKAR